jgi:hypothetical protein
MGYCHSCKQCPLCTAIASVVVVVVNDDDETAFACYYKCGFCEWNSKACGIVVVLDKKEPPIHKEKLMQVSKNLAEMATSKQEESLAALTAHYQDLMTTWAEQEFFQNDKPLNVKRGGIPHEGLQAWNVESLEESLVAKQQQQQLKAPNFIGNIMPVVAIMDDSPRLLDPALQTVATTTTLLLQPLASCNALPTLASELLPLPLPLRARTSRRCLSELQQGRAGILVKPKLNPLEGDSSLKSGHGQWWKKDSSAIHVIPKLTIPKHQKNKFLIQMANPNMCTVRVRLASSKHYTGEQGNDNHVIKHVLMDSLEEENYKNVVLDWNATCKNMAASEDFVELESVQDSFLEMGRVTRLPDAVATWNGSDESVITAEETSSCRLVACHKDVAWFELHVNSSSSAIPNIADSNDDDYVAVPIALQIQVGDGSWESSLIKQKETDDGPDFVTFHVLVAWKPNSTSRIAEDKFKET